MPLSGITQYVYDQAGHLLAESDDSGNTLTEYVWLDDMPIALIANVSSSPTLYFVHTDHLNRPIMMTDANKAIVWQADYNPFGGVYSITGSATNNLRFPGQYFLIEDGLHYNWYRHYDPTVGRYIQPDPLGFVNGPSIFAYVQSDPIEYADPLGLWQMTITGGAGGGLRIILGNNGGTGWFNGQWTVGVYGGFAEGFSIDLDPRDLGCVQPSMDGGMEAAGEIGLGPNVTAQADVGNTDSWSVGVGLPHTPLGASWGTDGASVPTVTFGESGFVGGGAKVHF